MNGSRLASIRMRVAPILDVRSFAHALGYVDVDAYLQYESGERPVPHLLALLAEMIDMSGMPEAWLNSAPMA